MRRLLTLLVGAAIIGAGAAYVITKPSPVDAAAFTSLTADVKHGQDVFWASGCASCHAADGAKDADLMVLSGGKAFATQFGTFYAPNISPDKNQGIGGWDVATFANAVQAGVTPEGEHEYPAMPYASYAKMAPQDLVDLKAFMDTLPASATPNKDHELSFPFNQRIVLGGWKFLFQKPGWVVNGTLDDKQTRGRYLVEALSHCGECHTPRNAMGGLDTSKWLGGAAMPDGKGKVPNITPAKLGWSEDDIFTYLSTGATPDFDFAGGSMAEVVVNMSHLPEADVRAIAAYVKNLAPVN